MSHNRSRVKHSNRVNHGNFPKPQRAGDVVNYHVLKCRPVINSTSPQVSNQHLQVLLQIESGQRYWVTINIREQSDKVYFYLDENYTHPVTQKILDAALPEGFTKLQSQPGGLTELPICKLHLPRKLQTLIASMTQEYSYSARGLPMGCRFHLMPCPKEYTIYI